MNDKVLTLNLRWMSILLALGLVQANDPANMSNPWIIAVLLIYAGSNLLLMRIPRAAFSPDQGWVRLVVLDIALISSLMYNMGDLHGDAFFLYLPVIAWSSCLHSARGIVGTVGIAVLAYVGMIMLMVSGQQMYSELLGGNGLAYRVLLLVVIGVFFGHLAQRLRQHRDGQDAVTEERQDLAAVVTAAEAFSATLKQNEVLGLLIQQVVQLVGAFRCSVALIDEHKTKGTLLISREILASEEDLGSRTLQIDLANYPEMARSLETGTTELVDDICNTEYMEPAQDTLSELGITSLMVVPIATDDPMIGTLQLCLARKSRPFTEREARVCELISSMAANVLKSAYMHDTLASRNVSLQKLAISDPLTGLYNRRFFDMRLSEEFRLASRHNLPLSVILFDVDHFKRVNDTYGHPVGDEVLVELGRAVRKSMRRSDCVARYGGEEFVVLLPLTGREAAVAKAEEMRLAVKEIAVKHDGETLRFTCSFGVASYDPEHCKVQDSLVSLADHAVYMAKQGGRDQVRSFTGDLVGLSSAQTG